MPPPTWFPVFTFIPVPSCLQHLWDTASPADCVFGTFLVFLLARWMLATHCFWVPIVSLYIGKSGSTEYQEWHRWISEQKRKDISGISLSGRKWNEGPLWVKPLGEETDDETEITLWHTKWRGWDWPGDLKEILCHTHKHGYDHQNQQISSVDENVAWRKWNAGGNVRWHSYFGKRLGISPVSWT